MNSCSDISLVWQCVEYWAEKKPEAEAIVFEDTRMTWAQLHNQVERTAKALLEMGVRKGECVALLSMARPEFIITFLAASKIGAIWLGLSPKFTLNELRYIIRNCAPAVLITVRKHAGVDLIESGITFGYEFPFIRRFMVIGESYEGALSFDEEVKRPREGWDEALEQRVAEVTPDDEALLMYTSGSTGRPKGVLHTHRGIVSNVALEHACCCFTDNERVLLQMPINHVAADVEIAYATLYAGGTLVCTESFIPSRSLELIEKERITMVGQLPVMYMMQLRKKRAMEMDWSSVRFFVWGGSAMPREIIEVLAKIAEKSGARLLTNYGSTELCGFATYSAPGDSLELLARSTGKAPAPFELRIVDEARNELSTGEVGELAVRGPSVMKGYLNDPVATQEVIDDDGWYYTRDLGYIDEEGNLYLCGRMSEMYKTGGENVFPREVEEVLESHPSVLFSAVIGVPDELYSEIGHAFVVLKPGCEVTERDLQRYCRDYLVGFKVPKCIEFHEELPLLATGKVNKVALKKRFGLQDCKGA